MILALITAIRQSFPESVKVYTEGHCYGFYKILKAMFPSAVAYYNSDHVITKINGLFYDITGEVDGLGYLEMEVHYKEYMEELENDRTLNKNTASAV
ncbi:MAG TPA: hypothetical protein DCS12_09010 [Clostridiales bacterium]|nr:hypothetical protein [Clostridiales bacterium]